MIKVSDVRINKSTNNMDLIVDFDNDRHHAVYLEKGYTCDEFVYALRSFATAIEHDLLLKE